MPTITIEKLLELLSHKKISNGELAICGIHIIPEKKMRDKDA